MVIEIEAELSGRELNFAVGERVMGWRRNPNGMMHGESQEVLVADNGSTRSVYCGCDEDWNPAESIEAAMEVVEKMMESGWQVNITGEDEAPRWYVEFDAREGDKTLLANHGAESLPEAICRAVLKAIASESS